MALTKHIWLYSDLIRAFKGGKIVSSGVLTEGTVIFPRPQCPITKTHLRQREMESCNRLNCSNNFKKIWKWPFFVIINELLRDKVIAIWNSI